MIKFRPNAAPKLCGACPNIDLTMDGMPEFSFKAPEPKTPKKETVSKTVEFKKKQSTRKESLF